MNLFKNCLKSDPKCLRNANFSYLDFHTTFVFNFLYLYLLILILMLIIWDALLLSIPSIWTWGMSAFCVHDWVSIQGRVVPLKIWEVITAFFVKTPKNHSYFSENIRFFPFSAVVLFDCMWARYLNFCNPLNITASLPSRQKPKKYTHPRRWRKKNEKKYYFV